MSRPTIYKILGEESTSTREKVNLASEAAAEREIDDRAAISPAQTFTGSCKQSSSFSGSGPV